MSSAAFLEPWAKPLVVLHALAAIALVGSSTHLAVAGIRWARGKPMAQRARLHASVTLAAYLTTFTLGLLAYPTYRTRIRGFYLDRYAPWASNLFDMKECFAALGLPLAITAFVLTRILESEADRATAPGYLLSVLGTAAIVWFGVVAGLVVALSGGM